MACSEQIARFSPCMCIRMRMRLANAKKKKKQGELVDNIEHHVQSTVDYVEKGHLELVQAEKYQSKARKVFFYSTYE